MDQNLINWLLGGFGALIGFLLNTVWQAVKDLQEKTADIEVLVAGEYVKRNELADLTKALFSKLDKIEEKIDRKADK